MARANTLSIAHTVASLHEMSAGPSYSVPSLAQAQADLGSDVSLYSVSGTERYGSPNLSDRRFAKDVANVPVLGRLWLSSSMSRALAAANHDIVHTHGLWLAPNIYGSSSGRFVIAPRGMLSGVALSFSPGKKWMIRKLFQDRAFSRAALFHATAQSEYEDIRQFGLRAPVAIIPNGIHIPPDANRTRQNVPRIVLSLGRIHPKKGLDRLLRAWTELEHDFPDWSLRIVGPDENNHSRELTALARELGLKRAGIHQPVFGDEKLAAYRGADLFVLPTRSENFAITVAESLACGTPVISTKGAPWQGLDENRCGWWIDHGPLALANALREAMLLTSRQRAEMGARGRAWMERDFSWDSIAVQMVGVYRWLVEGGDPPETVRID